VIYSVNAPEGYDRIVEYSHGGSKLSKDSAEMIFTQLLENIKVENCEYLEHITKAWFRQVPAKIYAVNYGHDGEGISYTLNDTTKAEYYRTTEPVKTVLLPNTSGQRRASEIAILLNEGESTLYTVFATDNFTAQVTIKAKTNQPGSEFSILLNETNFEFALSDTLWNELKIENGIFTSGRNTLKTEVNNGNVLLQYFDVQKK